jgi:hypothetical protein
LPLTLEELSSMDWSIFDGQWNIKFNYRYVQLKKPGNKYTTEIRTPDAAVNIDQLIEYTNRLYDKVNTIIQ